MDGSEELDLPWSKNEHYRKYWDLKYMPEPKGSSRDTDRNAGTFQQRHLGNDEMRTINRQMLPAQPTLVRGASNNDEAPNKHADPGEEQVETPISRDEQQRRPADENTASPSQGPSRPPVSRAHSPVMGAPNSFPPG